MRTAVLSDIHGNIAALEAVIADAEARGVDAFVNLGDSLSGPLWPAETADFLIARGWPAIAGNHERQLLAARGTMGASDAFAAARLREAQWHWVRLLPPTLVYDDMLLTHGTPTSDVEHLLFRVSDAGIVPAGDDEVVDRAGDAPQRLIWCGHTHIAATRVLTDGRMVANPGSVGLQAFDDDRPFHYIVENGDPRARYAIVEDGAITHHMVEYDHAAAAAKATREGFDDWARWLATGRSAG